MTLYNKIGETGKTKKFSFKLEALAPTAPIFYLCAENEEELTSWRREIIASVKVNFLKIQINLKHFL